MHVRNLEAGVGQRTQAARRERSRGKLLEAAARNLSRYGYANLKLAQVAADAGYTRGALYHQFADKEELAMAVLDWTAQSWQSEVGELVAAEDDPVAALLTLARGHAIFCRRDVARVEIALRLEFSGRDHPIGRHMDDVSAGLVKRCARLITAGRRAGEIPAGPPAPAVARALIGAVEGVVIAMEGKAPQDAELTVRAAAGVLGVSPGKPASR